MYLRWIPYKCAIALSAPGSIAIFETFLGG